MAFLAVALQPASLLQQPQRSDPRLGRPARYPRCGARRAGVGGVVALARPKNTSSSGRGYEPEQLAGSEPLAAAMSSQSQAAAGAAGPAGVTTGRQGDAGFVGSGQGDVAFTPAQRAGEPSRSSNAVGANGSNGNGSAAKQAERATDMAADAFTQANDAASEAAHDAADGAVDAAEVISHSGAQRLSEGLDSLSEQAEETQQQASEAVVAGAGAAANVAEAVQSAARGVQEQAALEPVMDLAGGAAEAAGNVKQAAEAVGRRISERAAEPHQPSNPQPAQALPPSSPSYIPSSPYASSGSSPSATSYGSPPSATSYGSSPSATSYGSSPSATSYGSSHPASSPAPHGHDSSGTGADSSKQLLIGMLASLDRGAAATPDQAQRVDALARQLERLGGPVSLSYAPSAEGGASAMSLLDGRWRLLYSSGFASGSVGGERPGPAFGSGPVTLGQVYQDILTDRSQLDNVVDLFLRFSLAGIPGIDAGTPNAHAILKHDYIIIAPNTVEITFTGTEVKLGGGLGGWLNSLPQFELPQLPDFLQPPRDMRSARFDVTYLDDQLRITRGDRGELRIFIKGEA